jgi:hypothetical protein
MLSRSTLPLFMAIAATVAGVFVFVVFVDLPKKASVE